MDTLPGMVSDNSHIVGLHLFIDGQEICHKDYHCFWVGEHHVLLCDLRTLFNDEEWQGLDARVGDNWKAIQVQCESHLVLSHWGLYVHKHKTNTIHDNIIFSFPNSKNHMPSSCLVPKSSPNQKIRHIHNLDLVEAFGQYLNTFKSEQSNSVVDELSRWCRNAKAHVRGASIYGASLMQEHEECVWDVAQILEMLMGNMATHICDAKFQSAGKLVVELLTTGAQPMKEKGHEVLHINMSMPIILEECECHFHPCRGLAEAPSRRYWGSVELEEGNPLVWRIWKGKKAFVLLKCKHCCIGEEASSSSGHVESLGEEEEYNDPVVGELLRRVEQDVMSRLLNRSQRKLKASIVPMDVPVSDKYMMETAIIRGQERLGRLGSKFNKTPYGKLRVELDAQCAITVQHELRMEQDGQSQNM